MQVLRPPHPPASANEPARMWMLLNEVADQLGVEVRLETLEDGEEFSARGGLCRLGSRLVAFVDRRRSPAGRARQLGLALVSLSLEGVYLKPAVREYLAGLAAIPHKDELS